MNLIDAIKSGRPFLRRANMGTPEGHYWWTLGRAVNCAAIDAKVDKFFTVEDILADDWEIQEKTVTITRSQFFTAWAETLKARSIRYMAIHGMREIDATDLMTAHDGAELAKKLGLEEPK